MRNLLHAMAAALALSLLGMSTAYAGAHGGQGVSKIDELPVRSGDWSEEEIRKGREQLVQAFDAAWIRIIASGRDQEVIAQNPPNQPGAAGSYMVRLVDCLPLPDLAPWPEKPVGMFKDILETGVIRQLVQGLPETAANTSWYFSPISTRFQEMVLEDIGKHYGVDLKVESVVLPPGTLPATSILIDGKVDFISQLNALGGRTQGMRRRTSRRFSCTMSASSQFIHIPDESPLVDEIKNLNDLIARPNVKICAGPLATQTAKAYMPQHTVKTKYINDLTMCDKAVKKGDLDVIFGPLHDLSIAGLEGYKSVHTLIVAGTPLWVAAEGITCEVTEDSKRGEPICSPDEKL
jgi:hypothetical protein